MLPLLDERQRRLYLANEAKAIGYGGISQVSRISGISRVTITLGMAEISSEGYQPQAQTRLRKKGGGRKLIETNDPEILQELDELLEPYTKGDPMNPLKWTSKSTRALETELEKRGYKISVCFVKYFSLKKARYFPCVLTGKIHPWRPLCSCQSNGRYLLRAVSGALIPCLFNVSTMSTIS